MNRLLLVITAILVTTGHVPRALGQEGRTCRTAVQPKHLPAADAVLDSAAAMRVLADLAVGDTGSVLVSVILRSKSEAPTVTVLEPADSMVVADTVRRVVATLLRSPSGPPLWGIRLRIHAGPVSRLAVERSTYCPPEAVKTYSGQQRMLVHLSPMERPQTGRVQLETEDQISETGVVTDVRLIQRSGMSDLDDQFLNAERGRKFLPALLDGVPVPGWVRSDGAKSAL